MSMELMVKAMKIRVGNPLRKLVLIKLADNASDQGECWPSYQHIADQCEISKRSVMNHIAALCESGLVKKVTRKGEKGNSSNIYLLHLDGAGDSLGGSANNSLSGAANSPGSAGVALGGSAGDSPRTSHSFEPVKEPVNEPIAVGASADESVRVRSNRPEYSPEFEQAWLAYPKRAGGNSKSAAFKAWKARLNEGVNPETMLEGVKRYAGWVSAMGNSGTQFVKQAVTFFGPDRHFEESWEVPAVSGAFLQVENMMFLKQGTFNYEKQSVVLSELSGLQRIEYLAFVQQRTAKFDAEEGELPEAERQIAFLRMGMDINAWLVSRSLWNADQSQDVETLCASVITTWSYDALGAGAEMVLSLSGMGTIDNAGDDEHEALTPEKS